jgi:hypothetical protein
MIFGALSLRVQGFILWSGISANQNFYFKNYLFEILKLCFLQVFDREQQQNTKKKQKKREETEETHKDSDRATERERERERERDRIMNQREGSLTA